MPASYPPIAPRRGEPRSVQTTTPTVTDSFNHVVQSVDAPDQLARLAALEANPNTIVDAHHPMRDAVAIALLKPAGDLIKRHVARQRMVTEALAAPPDSDDPTEAPMPLVADDGTPAWLAIAETQVARALLGDTKAFNTIADRIEGKAGLRKADQDAETEAQRQRVRITIEELVRDMGERRRMVSDDARVIDADIIER